MEEKGRLFEAAGGAEMVVNGGGIHGDQYVWELSRCPPQNPPLGVEVISEFQEFKVFKE